jgi:glycerol-3-phosphate dehydrogenase
MANFPCRRDNTTPHQRYDLIAIGGGSGGLAVTQRAAGDL